MIIMVMSHSLTLLVRDILNTETANDVIFASVPFCFWINQNFAIAIPVKACLAVLVCLKDDEGYVQMIKAKPQLSPIQGLI